MGFHTKKYMATTTRHLNQPFLHHLIIFEDLATSLMLSMGLLMQGEIFADSHRHCAMREGGEDGHFWCKKGIGRLLLP